ncbi:helix-turn-helix transcriptional regulator [Cryobacterium zhongshanensis]|uniref:Helix-turn-helix domain-containing protein n=1 Tax=Cryobacterium zhongshanensis TaxID=2928153 RepID=A0AA41QV75_9MICO|nr:helix-turn-helix transcriptional regulator [Cryobacterium zhongshanensis]MCI4657334.1 helix-turn-helix domain-containing protein [Cryobacterium zhongshanensis]
MAKRTEVDDDAWCAYVAELATNLRRLRLSAVLSQEDVAYRAGLTRYTYQKYEKGESAPGRPANPTIRTLLAIAQVLQVPLSDILPNEVPDLRLR